MEGSAAPIPPAKTNEMAEMDFVDARTGRKRSNARSFSATSSKFSRSAEVLNPTTTSNRYQSLSDAEEQPTMPPLTPIPTPRKVLPTPSAPAEQETTNSKRERVPTITIKWEIPRVRDEIRLMNIKSTDFLLKQTRDGTVVKLSSLKIYEQFLKRCIDRQLPHFTHAVDASKPLRIVLLGLPNMPVEDVMQALSELNVQPEDIKPMRVRNTRFLEHNNFILYFRKGSISIGGLREIKAINNVLVRWTYYDAKRHGPTQCRRCQAWGHGSSHCHLPPACVKCAGAHETSACPASAKGEKVPETQLKCVNCQKSHSANYGGCECRQSYIASRPKRQWPRSPRGARSGYNHDPASYLQDTRQYPPLPPGQQPQYQHQSPDQHHRQQIGDSYKDKLMSKNPNSHNLNNYSNNNINNNFNNCKNLQNNLDITPEDTPFTPEEIFEIFMEILPIVNSGKSQKEQLRMVFQLAKKYRDTFGGRP